MSSVKQNVVYISHYRWEEPSPVNISVKEFLFDGFRRNEDRPCPENYIWIGSEKALKQITDAVTGNDVIIMFGGAMSLDSWKAVKILWQNGKFWRKPLVVYWHETSVAMRNLASIEYGTFSSKIQRKLRFKAITRFLEGPLVWHLATSAKCKLLVMYLFGTWPKRIYIINEAASLSMVDTAMNRDVRPVRNMCMAGVPCWRKGCDLFLQFAEKYGDHSSETKFSWYGGTATELANWRRRSLKQGLSFNRVDASGYKNLQTVLPKNDVFLLTSRDDPFPFVALEALAADLPVFCFDTTGIAEIMPPEFVCCDLADMMEKVSSYAEDPSRYPANTFHNIAIKYDSAHARRIWQKLVEHVIHDLGWGEDAGTK